MPLNVDTPWLQLAPLIELRWGTNVRRYVRADNTIIADDGGPQYTYSPIQVLKIECEPQHGGIQDHPYRVTCPIGLDPVDKMIGRVFAPVTCTILEADIGIAAAGVIDFADVHLVFEGKIGEVIARRRGKADVAEFSVLSLKERMRDIPLGLIATQGCDWIFGSDACGFDVAANATETRTIVDIDGETITMDGLTHNTNDGGGNGYYSHGWVLRDGLRLGIRKHITDGSRRLKLWRVPPQSPDFTWLNEEVTVVGGCDKSRSDCEFWDGQSSHSTVEQFAGLGLKMRSYNPVIEDGA